MVRPAEDCAAVRVWLWPEVGRTGVPVSDRLSDGSYTSFEMSALRVGETFVRDVSSIQKTNERYEGSAELYDVLVSGSPFESKPS